MCETRTRCVTGKGYFLIKKKLYENTISANIRCVTYEKSEGVLFYTPMAMQGVYIKNKVCTIKSCVTGKGVFLIKRCAKKAHLQHIYGV